MLQGCEYEVTVIETVVEELIENGSRSTIQEDSSKTEEVSSVKHEFFTQIMSKFVGYTPVDGNYTFFFFIRKNSF